MEIKKTVGHAGEGRKDYTITTKCGTEFFCEATGSQGYRCNGVKFKSIKDIKSDIEDADATWEVDKGGFELEEEAEPKQASEITDLWHTCCPVALMVVLLENIPIGENHPECKELLRETLDNYGMITDGKVDIEYAKSEVARTLKLRKMIKIEEKA